MSDEDKPMNTHATFRMPAHPVRVRFETQPDPLRTVSSEALFDGTNEIAIAHAGSLYRLRITRQGKLILNK